MFEEALRLAKSYGQKYSSDINMDLLAELEERLRQLEFINQLQEGPHRRLHTASRE
jgi:hypothetical protein